MNSKKVIKTLQKKYSGKKIVKNDAINPTEILCEVEPTNEHPEFSKVVSVIDKSKPHVHKKTTETYKVIKGKLILYIGDKIQSLSENDKYIIRPELVHWAEGEETWVECYSEPGWTKDDHFLVE